MLNPKYKCDNCDDVFYKSNTKFKSEVDKDFTGKDYHICPSCHSVDFEETDDEVAEVYRHQLTKEE